MSDVRQEINLFSEDMLPQRTHFNARDTITVWGVCLALLACLSLWDFIDRQSLLEVRDGLNTQLISVVQLTQNMREEIEPSDISALEEDVKKLTRERDQAMRLLSILQQGELAQGALFQTQGFSGYLRELAIHHVDGMWLTEIHLSRGGEQIQLAGKTLKATHVPRFLSLLSNGEKFHGHKFEHFEIVESDSDVLRFSMQGPVMDNDKSQGKI